MVQYAMRVFRPNRTVLVRKTRGLIGIVIGAYVFYDTVKWIRGGWPAVEELLPIQAFFLVLLVGYLLFLRRALFVALAHGCEVRADEDDVEIKTLDQSCSTSWEAIRRIELGDLQVRFHLSSRRPLEVPFLTRADQREIFHMHFQKTGLRPNRMPMTTFPRRYGPRH